MIFRAVYIYKVDHLHNPRAFVITPTRYNSEEHLDTICSGLEICMTINGFTMFNAAEKNGANQSIACDQQKHPHDDEEAFVDGHEDSQDQHFQRCMFT